MRKQKTWQLRNDKFINYMQKQGNYEEILAELAHRVHFSMDCR